MSVLVKDMTMPRDCPMCPMAHWNASNMFSGCEAVPDKKYAISDPEYANSDHRPDWCPLVDVQPHGDLIDRNAFSSEMKERRPAVIKWMQESVQDHDAFIRAEATAVFLSELKLTLDKMPTIIAAEEGET